MSDLRLVMLFRLGFLFAYAFALVMSTAHLSAWYRLTLGDLPEHVAVGLAVSLEVSAFLLSMSSAAFPSSLPTARVWAYGALGLVWVGNLLAMYRAASVAGVPPWEVFFQSLFVPVSTLAVGKVLGDLHRLDRSLREGASKEPSLLKPSSRDEEATDLGFFPSTLGGEDHYAGTVVSILRSARRGLTLPQLSVYVPLPPEEMEEILRRLEREGLVENQGGVWRIASGDGSRVHA